MRKYLYSIGLVLIIISIFVCRPAFAQSFEQHPSLQLDQGKSEQTTQFAKKQLGIFISQLRTMALSFPQEAPQRAIIMQAGNVLENKLQQLERIDVYVSSASYEELFAYYDERYTLLPVSNDELQSVIPQFAQVPIPLLQQSVNSLQSLLDEEKVQAAVSVGTPRMSLSTVYFDSVLATPAFIEQITVTLAIER